jgi:hypothetical protein
MALLSVCISLHIVATQWLGKQVLAATNTQATTEKLLRASFSMRSVSYQRNFLFILCDIFPKVEGIL